MRVFQIGDSRARLQADILPEYGGMVARLRVDGTEVLRLDESLLNGSPMLAGGMPLMFPFPSKTRGDTYHIGGKPYYMPFHGIVKNRSFAVKSVDADSATLWIDAGQSTRESNYPFDFLFEVEYRLDEKGLTAAASITNRSASPMPHCLGWHPYFLATDKRRLRFRHNMDGKYDYVACRDVGTVRDMDLSQTWDDVFFAPAKCEFTLQNDADGYAVRCEWDKRHQVLVVCTTTPDSVCVEPWCGLPDSINNGRFVQWIGPLATETYWMRIEPSRI